MITQYGWFAARTPETEEIDKVYAESFRGKDHLRQIQEEAQAIVAQALAQQRAVPADRAAGGSSP